MKKLSILCAILLVIAVSTLLVYSMNNKPLNYTDEHGVEFADVKISKEQAIKIAKKNFEGVDESNSISIKTDRMKCQYQDIGFDKPIYIVTFGGLNILPSGGTLLTDEERAARAHTKMNVIVEANTGEVLYLSTS